MEQRTKYYFIVQEHTLWNTVIFMTSSFAYETIEQYIEASGTNPNEVIAYTKVPAHLKDTLPKHLPF